MNDDQKLLAFIIALPDEDSQAAAKKCIQSIKDTDSDIIPVLFPAVEPKNVPRLLKEYNLSYTYPTGIARIDKETQLLLTPYKTKNIDKRIACFLSHYQIWRWMSQESVCSVAECIILEQDAFFERKFDIDVIWSFYHHTFIISLNSPMGATRKASVFDHKLKAEYNKLIDEEKMEYGNIFEAPWIDDEKIPQGLPGNSAYIISHLAANDLCDMVEEIQIWPNDALMCKQLFPNKLFSIYPYITKIQNNPSTTSN